MKCLHCKEKCLGGAKYCCLGCEAAHRFISSVDLSKYYEFCKKIYESKPMKVNEFANLVDYDSYVINDGKNHKINLNIEGIHCGSCVWLIENALAKESDVVSAKVNLSTQRMVLVWSGGAQDIKKYTGIIQKLGYKPLPYEPDKIEERNSEKLIELLKMIAISGVGALSVMMLTMGVWFGNADESMQEYSRSILHFAALIVAIPTTLYSAREFWYSAYGVLKNGHVNMDVPISMSIIVAFSISIYQTFTFSEYVYFDAALMLIFFLLIGRYLDLKVRNKARQQTQSLVLRQPKTVTLFKNGKLKMISITKAKVGDIAFVAAGEKIPVDGEIVEGESSVDQSIITGESLPIVVDKGFQVIAGSINLDGPIKILITKTGENSTIAEIIKLIEAAEQKGSSYIRIADKIASYFTPVVIGLAVLTFAGWAIALQDYQGGLLASAAVLIVACPCAVGLAVPIVQVVASSFLMSKGVLIKTPDALERIKHVDKIYFDKTGTLTLGKPVWKNVKEFSKSEIQLLASMAAKSTHPLSKAIASAHKGKLLEMKIEEVKGGGLSAPKIKLGSRKFCSIKEKIKDDYMEVWLLKDGKSKRLIFEDALKSGAKELISTLKKSGVEVALISGDHEAIVAKVAKKIGIEEFQSGLSPKDKYDIIEQDHKDGKLVMMVGDGLNDSAAMQNADVSISPSSSLDLALNTADIVFYGDKLQPIVLTKQTAELSHKLILQNFVMSFVYNFVTIPLAMFGFVTPVFAAIVMSSSSMLVVGNSLRLRLLNDK